MLFNRLLAVYLITMLAGILILQVETLVSSQFERQFPFPLVIVSLGALILACAAVHLGCPASTSIQVLQIGTGTELELTSDSQTNTALRRLYRLPYELLGGVVSAGLLFSLGFHGLELLDDGLEAELDWLQLLGTVVGEQSLFIFIGIILFTAVRRILRPVLMQLQPLPSGFDGPASVAQPLVVTYTCTFIVTILSLLQLAIVTARPHDAMDPYKFGIIALFYFIMGLSLFCYVTIQLGRSCGG